MKPENFLNLIIQSNIYMFVIAVGGSSDGGWVCMMVAGSYGLRMAVASMKEWGNIWQTKRCVFDFNETTCFEGKRKYLVNKTLCFLL